MLYVLRISWKDFLFGFTFVYVEMTILFCFDNTGFVLLSDPPFWKFKTEILRMRTKHETSPVKLAE